MIRGVRGSLWRDYIGKTLRHPHICMYQHDPDVSLSGTPSSFPIMAQAIIVGI